MNDNALKGDKLFLFFLSLARRHLTATKIEQQLNSLQYLVNLPHLINGAQLYLVT